MMKYLIFPLFLLAACQAEAPPHEAGHEVPANLQAKNTIPLNGEMNVDNKYMGAMLVQHVQEQQDIELLYREKVYPAVVACMRQGLLKDPEQMQQLNRYVDNELTLMAQAGKDFRDKKDQESLTAWQTHHDNAYRTMGKMLDLTGQLKYHTEPPRKLSRDELSSYKQSY